MRKMLGIIGIVAILGISNAQDYSRYCPTITAIYGVCSEQLVQNWLIHQNDTYVRRSPPKTEIAKPSGTGDRPNDSQDFKTLPSTASDTPEARKPSILCYCGIDDSRRCVINGEYKIVEEYNEKCEIRRRAILGLPPKEQWFKNKIWMVS